MTPPFIPMCPKGFTVIITTETKENFIISILFQYISIANILKIVLEHTITRFQFYCNDIFSPSLNQ